MKEYTDRYGMRIGTNKWAMSTVSSNLSQNKQGKKIKLRRFWMGIHATVIKKDVDTISLEIKRENFETFCNAVGLFRKGFLDILESSEKDHKEGRIRERNSLLEIIK